MLEAPKNPPAPTTSQMLERGSQELKTSELVKQFVEQNNDTQHLVESASVESGMLTPKMTDALDDDEFDAIKSLCGYDEALSQELRTTLSPSFKNGDIVEFYDPQNNIAYGRYVIDESGKPLPILNDSKSKKGKRLIIGKPKTEKKPQAKSFYVDINEPTRAQDNEAISRLEKELGISLDEIKYKVGELRPENIDIEEIISEFGV